MLQLRIAHDGTSRAGLWLSRGVNVGKQVSHRRDWNGGDSHDEPACKPACQQLPPGACHARDVASAVTEGHRNDSSGRVATACAIVGASRACA